MLSITGLTKSYETSPLLRGVSFSVAAGETVCLLGASGSGKSTILRIIAGLETPESGDVTWEGQSMRGIPAHRRQFGLMFQDYALFPHLRVIDNIAFGLEMQRSHQKRGTDVKTRVRECLELVHLEGFENRRVTELSGGEQQRVALARALAPNPRLLMLDEPLGALDRALKENLLAELRQILRQTGIPAIYVTHDQQEAFTLADRIILLRQGQIAQEGAPPEVFDNPANGWVASFLGLGNVLNGRMLAGGFQPLNRDILPLTGLPVSDTPVTLLIRPQAELASQGISGRVTDVVFQGQSFRIELDNGLYFSLHQPVQLGQQVTLRPHSVSILSS